MNTNELKTKLSTDLAKAAKDITSNEKLQICVALDIAPLTFERYTSGRIEECRRTELAEKIKEQIKAIKAKRT